MQLIAGNPDRISHEVRARDHGGRMTIFGAGDETEEADWICRQIERLRHAQPEAAIAVLVRARSQLPELERAFQAARLPYVVVGLRSWWDSPPIRVVLDYIAFCTHPEIDAFLTAVCNVPARGIGPKSLADLRQRAGSRPMWVYLQEMMAENPKAVPRRWRVFVEEMSRWIRLRDEVTPQEWLQKLIEFLRQNWARDPARRASYEERWRELLHVVRDVREWGDLAEQLSLQQPEDLLPEDRQRAVYIMTVHSAKGLEFDDVFIPGVEEGLFPHFLSRTEAERREERRVFFVAITRARAEVFLTWAASRRGWTRRPSPFLRDMPLEEMRIEGRSLRPWFPGRISRVRAGARQRAASQEPEPIRAGDLVEHAHYGRGIVRSVTGTGPRTRVRIWFFRGESREFLLAKAPIRLIHVRPHSGSDGD